MALRPFIKLLLVSAWSWGSWSFISRMVSRPAGQDIPKYVNVFYSIWESVFFAALLLFIEKFILQLIGKCGRDPVTNLDLLTISYCSYFIPQVRERILYV